MREFLAKKFVTFVSAPTTFTIDLEYINTNAVSCEAFPICRKENCGHKAHTL